MKYNDIPCAACKQPFTETDDVVVCPVCGAPHHRACWKQLGHCAFEDKHAAGYEWTSPLPEPASARPGQKEDDAPRRLKNGEGVATCPRCGESVFEHDIFCLHCGQRLIDVDPTEPERQQAPDPDAPRRFIPDESQDETDESFRPNEEFYEDFYRFGGIDPNATIEDIPVWEYAAFVGGRKPGAIVRRIYSMKRFGSRVSVTLAALLLGPIWYFYRKMFREGIALTAVLLALNIAVGVCMLTPAMRTMLTSMFETFAEVRETMDPAALQDKIYDLYETYAENITQEDRARLAAANILQYLVIGVYVLGGMFGLSRYHKKVVREIHAIRSRCTDMDQYRAALAVSGGTSVGAAVIGAILNGIGAMLQIYLPVLIVLFSGAGQ